jgi:hypothetical protein
VAPLSPSTSVACRSTKSLLTKRTLHKTTGSWTKRLNGKLIFLKIFLTSLINASVPSAMFG